MRRSVVYRKARSADSVELSTERARRICALVGGLLAPAVCLGCLGNSQESREQQCERLRDHVVEMRVATIPHSIEPSAEDLARLGGSPPPKDAIPQQPDIEGHRAALKQALGHEYIESCVATLTTAQLECSLGAKDTAGLTVCQSSGH